MDGVWSPPPVAARLDAGDSYSEKERSAGGGGAPTAGAPPHQRNVPARGAGRAPRANRAPSRQYTHGATQAVRREYIHTGGVGEGGVCAAGDQPPTPLYIQKKINKTF